MSDFWNSLETVSRWSSYANGAIALLGVFAALLGFAVFILGRREALLSERETTNANKARDELITNNQRKTAEAIESAAKIEREAARDRLELAKLKSRDADRVLDPEKTAQMKSAFWGYLPDVPVYFLIDENDNEVTEFANQLSKLLYDCGFSTHGDFGIPATGIPKGIRVVANETEAKQASTIRKCLEAGGFKVMDGGQDFAKAGAVKIIIGAKR